MSRRIAMIAPPWYQIPPSGYGGIELVVGLLVRELRAGGDEVVLFGEEGSDLVSHPTAPDHWTDDLGAPRERWRELTYAAQTLPALEALGDFDVIHDHCGMATLLGAAMANHANVVHTVHGPINEPERTYYASLPQTVGLVSISYAQRATAPTLRWIGTVPNAVDLDALHTEARDTDDPYLLLLARVCRDKGQHVAIDVAKRSGLRLVLAGKVENTEDGREYFEREIKPHVDGDRVQHIEDAAGEDKARLLARATAFIAPLQWEEPFGLAYAEAMVSGTPLIAFPRGAAPELVTEGVTGYLVDGVDAMVDAVGRVHEINRDHCAAAARERFSPAAMADGYRGVYDAAASQDLEQLAVNSDAHMDEAASANGGRPAATPRARPSMAPARESA